MTLTAAYGLVACTLMCGAATTLVPFNEFRHRAALIATGLGAIGIAPALHGVLGTPSFTLFALVVLRLLPRPAPWPLDFRPALALNAVALCFYPLALGLGSVDPYAFGYRPWPLLAALVPVGIVLWRRDRRRWLFILAADLLAYGAGIFANLWDALFDPLLVVLALYQVARHWRARGVNGRGLR